MFSHRESFCRLVFCDCVTLLHLRGLVLPTLLLRIVHLLPCRSAFAMSPMDSSGCAFTLRYSRVARKKKFASVESKATRMPVWHLQDEYVELLAPLVVGGRAGVLAGHGGVGVRRATGPPHVQITGAVAWVYTPPPAAPAASAGICLLALAALIVLLTARRRAAPPASSTWCVTPPGRAAARRTQTAGSPRRA